MRFALVRGWAVAATAILAAAVADAATEFAENSGWLGGALRDNQHESIVPALLLGLAIAFSLALYVLLARVSPRDPLLLRLNELQTRLVDVAVAFCGSTLCVVAMEGYETRFGGLSPFDPRSVVLSHAPALLVAFVVTAVAVYAGLAVAVRTAARASVAVAAFLVAFLRKFVAGVAPPRALALPAFRLRAAYVPLAIAHASRGLRAPPRSVLPRFSTQRRPNACEPSQSQFSPFLP
jgi:hypothetical protein